MTDAARQFDRKGTLVLTKGGKALDLSEMRFRFTVEQEDIETPNNAEIRVYNLNDSTVRQIRGEFDTVTLQAGYQDNYGVIFQGSIKQFRRGRENATDKFFDLLCADGDLAYNFSTISHTLGANWTQTDAIKAAVEAMKEKGIAMGYFDEAGMLGGTIPNPRGKVLFGLPKAMLRTAVKSVGATWNINNGKVNVIPLDSYKPGEAVVLTSKTGLIGLPEQTPEGVNAVCLINPRITVGGLVRIDNSSVTETLQQKPTEANLPFVPFNRRVDLQSLATVAADGLYRVFSIKYEGDNRGTQWYSRLVCLAVNQATRKVVRPNG